MNSIVLCKRLRHNSSHVNGEEGNGMSRIIFVEYRIDPNKREAYELAIDRLLRTRANCILYEGSDQPNVFVEQYFETTPEQYAHMKQQRLEQESEWDEITACIPGGRSKLHIWEFVEKVK